MTKELELFQLKFRVLLLERLMFPLVLERLVLNQGTQDQEARALLKGLLKAYHRNALKIYGKSFRGDPALVALFSDEIGDVVASLEALIDEL